MGEKFVLKSVCGEDKIFKKEDSFPMTEKQIVNELNTNEEVISELIEENKKLQSINQDHCDYIADVEADFVRLEKENKELMKLDENRKEYQRTLESKIRRLKDRIKVLEKR